MLGAFEVAEASAMKNVGAPGASWVGKVDCELRRFHGDEYSTWRGSSYNSYLVEDEKVVHIDTVWMPYAKEFVDGLERAVGLDRIDFVISSHGEIDHSGSLPELQRRRPGLPVYCTASAVKNPSRTLPPGLGFQDGKNWRPAQPR
jgi:anaerobic nitric oxide reductase flavorubredoxin